MPSPYNSSSPSPYTMNSPCPGDPDCVYALRCYECDTSQSQYVLEEGFCISRASCRKYSRYNSTSITFNPDFCTCFDGFYITGVTSCSRCHITCSNCQSTSSTACDACPIGASLSSSPGSCSYNVTYQ